jgi:hypothetical protein
MRRRPHPRTLTLSTLLLAFAVTISIAQDARADAPKISPDAKLEFDAGVALLQDPARPRYEEAYRRFKAAYALAPVPQILGNLGLCAMKLERDAEAIDAYERYLKGVPDIEPGERAQIERDLLTLRTGVTRLSVTSDPPGAMLTDTRVTTNGEDVTNTYGPITGPTELALRQGHHVIRARLPDRPEEVYEFDAVGAQLQAKLFAFSQPLPPGGEVAPPRPVPTSVYVTGAITGALAFGTVVTGILAAGKKNDFDNANNGLAPEHSQHLRDQAQTLNTVTDALLIGTVVVGITTAYLYLTRPAQKRPTVGRLELRF